MGSLWSFISKPANRAVLGWLGGGAVVVAGGIWALVTYMWPPHEAPTTACAQQGITVGGSVSGSTVTNTVTGSSGSGPCADTKAAK